MANVSTSATQSVFCTPELLEHIFCFLLTHILPLTNQEDPRSVRVYNNSNILHHLLRCTQVCKTWHRTILGSVFLQRALFLIPDHTTQRSWARSPTHRRLQDGSYFRASSLRAPQLNPLIQTSFPSYHFRFWHLHLVHTGSKHCAYLIVSRRDVPHFGHCAAANWGGMLSNMLLSQPPCTSLEASIWEERDTTSDCAARDAVLKDPILERDAGIRLGDLHDRARAWFERYPDVVAVKLTTT